MSPRSAAVGVENSSMFPMVMVIGIVGVIGAIIVASSFSSESEIPKTDLNQGTTDKASGGQNSNQNHQSNEEKSSNTQSGGSKKNRRRSAVTDDVESSSFDENQYPNLASFNRRVRSPANHFVVRIVRLFRLGPLVQEIERVLNISREYVLVSGPSQYQDQRSQGGPDYHAAHVIAVSINETVLKFNGTGCVKILINFLGHTQNVTRFANINKVGKDLDKMQKEHLKSIIGINYSGSLTAEDADTINAILDNFKNMLYENSLLENNEEHRAEYQGALNILNTITAEEVFERAKKVCSDGGMDTYECPQKRKVEEPEESKRPKKS